MPKTFQINRQKKKKIPTEKEVENLFYFTIDFGFLFCLNSFALAHAMVHDEENPKDEKHF